MYGLLQAFAKWLEGTPWGVGVRTSLWAYPFTQLVHFTGLSIWLGTNLALDLRLLGLGKHRETAAQLRDDLFAWNWIGFCIVVTGGFLLFSSTSCNGRRATGEQRRTLRPSQNFRASRKFCFGFA